MKIILYKYLINIVNLTGKNKHINITIVLTFENFACVDRVEEFEASLSLSR
jgi:hypothetical protein